MNIFLAILVLVLGIAIYLGAFLVVPLAIPSKTKLTKGKINTIVIINIIVVFIIFQLIINPSALTTNFVMGVISFFIGRRILNSKCLTI